MKKLAVKKGQKIAQAEAKQFLGKQLYTPHHINPLKGHPINITKGKTVLAQFPMGGLPNWIHSGGWNILKIPKTAAGYALHMAEHSKQIAKSI